QQGWTDPQSLACFVGGLAVLLVFMWWEGRSTHPMLDVKFFRNPRFTAASVSIMFVFFALFGGSFLLTQVFQFVLGYGPLETGIRFLPIAGVILVLSPLSPRFAHRFGTKLVVGVGLLVTAAGRASWGTITADTAYWRGLVWRSALMASGIALVMAPATESIMGSLPLGKAGVGSAVTDNTRQGAGVAGVAVGA